MKYILITLLLLVGTPNISCANFSGMSFIDSPLAPAETLIDEILSNDKISQQVAPHPEDLKNLRRALIKGCSNDRDVFVGLIKVRNTITQEKEYDKNLAYIKTAALEFGYHAQ